MITVDRIEDDTAVLDLGDGRTLDVPLALLPAGAKEGDGLAFVLQPVDPAEAEARLARLKAKTPQGPGTFDL